MAYGFDSQVFLLKEGFLQIGDWPDISLITPATDPALQFNSDGDVGYFKQGSSKIEISRQYAEFIAGTPGKSIRMDLVLKKFTMTFSFAQFDTDRLALAQGLEIEPGLFDIAWIGSDETGGTISPTGFNGYLLYTQRTDGTPFNVAQWYGKNVSENVGWALSGTEHGVYDIVLRAFEAPHFQTNTNDVRNYGAIFFDNTSTT